MNRTVTSPVGESVEVLDRATLADLLEVEDRALSQALALTDTRWKVLEALWFGGEVVDRPSGRAMTKLGERIGIPGREVTTAMGSPIMRLCTERDVNARRTFAVKLTALPDRWHERLIESNHHRAATEPEPEVEPEPPRQLRLDDEPELEPMGLLTEAIRLIASAMPQLVSTAPEINPEVLDRLATTLEDNERLRRKLAQAGDELTAVKHERDGLRQAKRALEANLAEMAKGAFNEVTYRRFVDLDRLLRQPPRSAKDAS